MADNFDLSCPYLPGYTSSLMKALISFFVLLFWSTAVFAWVRVDVSDTELSLGEPIRVEVASDSPIRSSKLSLGGRSFTLFKDPRTTRKFRYVAFVALSRHSSAKSVKLYTKLRFRSGEVFSKSYTLSVNYPKKPKKGKVTLSKRKSKLSSSQKHLKKEGALITKRFALKTPESYMIGRFILPVNGKKTSGFAALRLYNGTYKRSHAGVDYANRTGTKIVAPNGGKVVLSERLNVHGHTVMIDHGLGVVTIYNHLNSRDVSVGDRVAKGQLLGRLGETGVATGPHLHWGMSVQNVRVDPEFFLSEDMF